ncbi:hypothetical protein C8F04DRAFT_1078497 [Mycena alexandri]|uniref:Secreted protein n=1 Tax=Mycena alexandri TaxID=1745969 RepID=A0AAD6T8Z0_9AGAR|nr:hypothetical protein C8F04DRAFT_1078497 [Mycena alexandri]
MCMNHHRSRALPASTVISVNVILQWLAALSWCRARSVVGQCWGDGKVGLGERGDDLGHKGQCRSCSGFTFRILC